MIQTLILTFVVCLVAVLAMVAGVLITGRSLKGSCGGPSCKCVAEGEDVLECGKTEPSPSSLPMHSNR
ncbi:MAG: hypothetical protein E4H44_00725 [Candidatus Aminicenantes bacterium]|nr:MAG: hypothetical protein E4H44_00725 [Candidatus Aminicenantes bacterium]